MAIAEKENIITVDIYQHVGLDKHEGSYQTTRESV